MRKHDVSYHEYNDFIVFKKEHCTHIKTSEFSFLDLSMSDSEEFISTKTKTNFKFIKILKRSETFNESKTKLNESENKEIKVLFRKELNSLSRSRKLNES